MPDDSIKSSKRLLDPIDRISEILFGLIMVLTFTGSLSVAEAGREDVRMMLIGAIGCNLAWGIIDAVMYLMELLTDRGRNLMSLRSVRNASKAEDAHQVIADALPPVVVSVLRPDEIESIRQRMQTLPEPSVRPRLGTDDWLAALAVFTWVFVSTFPVVLPFMLMHDASPRTALRVSNGIAIVMLYLVGWSLGRHAGHRAWQIGLAMVLVGVVLVAITIALGG